jgi:hypothetical protein
MGEIRRRERRKLLSARAESPRETLLVIKTISLYSTPFVAVKLGRLEKALLVRRGFFRIPVGRII